jgi:hypothetical protein
VALALDQYVLRPPHHNQDLLANHQYDWLSGAETYPGPDALSSGWQALGLSGEAGVLAAAVARANAGHLVLAAFAAHDRTKAGHICIVRPQTWSEENGSGPMVMSAGDVNYRAIDMMTAFKKHEDAWPSAIALFSCRSGLENDSPPGDY